MSAFFVGTDHVNAMLSYVNALVRQSSMPMPPDGAHQKDTGDVAALTEIGKALLSENIKSLQARYPSDWQEMVDSDVNAFAFDFDSAFVYDRRNPHTDVIGLCECYEYQSCEHDGWSDSFGKHFSEWLVRQAIRKLPGSENTPWHYERPAEPARRVLFG